MSQIKALSSFTEDEKKILRKKGIVRPRADDWNPYPKPIDLYEKDDFDNIWFPFALKNEIECINRSTSDEEFRNNSFETKLKLYNKDTDPRGLKDDRGNPIDQQEIFKNAIQKLKRDNYVFLNLSTGFGKSAMGVHICSKIKRGLSLILVYNFNVQKQWKTDGFEMFSTAKVQHLKGKQKIKDDTNVVIMGLATAAKKDRDFFNPFSLVLIDEVDQLPAKTLLRVMKKMNPVYLVGMSATINRTDNMHQALYSYFGERKEFIKCFIVKDFDVLKIQTDFEPEIEYFDNGMVNNNVLTDSIAYNKSRQKFIADLVKHYKDERILLLSNRIAEIEGVWELLKDEEECDYRTDKKTSWDTKKRVLIGGFKSCGRGLDIKGLSVLILCTSVNNVQQNEGRIRMNENLIIDIVDKHAIFEKRWEKRKCWYKKRGANLFWKNWNSDKTFKM